MAHDSSENINNVTLTNNGERYDPIPRMLGALFFYLLFSLGFPAGAFTACFSAAMSAAGVFSRLGTH